MTRGISKKEQRSDLRRLRAQAASELALGAKKPVAASAAKRAPARLPDAHYPTKRAALGRRQASGAKP
jgi:hypothetical protein